MTIHEQAAARSAVGSPLIRARRVGLIASGLLVLSALLQWWAAVQRWVFAAAADQGQDGAIEDHLFDYVIPADPWVSVGSAASLFGVSYLLIGASLVCMGVAVRSIGRERRGVLAAAVVAAAPFFGLGAHALVSGLLGAPSPLQLLFATYGALVVGVIQVVAPIVFAGFIVARAWVWSIGVLLLVGASLFGYVFAMVSIAPVLVGYQSYDTTPWTEAVLAAFTAVAAVMVAVGNLQLRSAPVA